MLRSQVPIGCDDDELFHAGVSYSSMQLSLDGRPDVNVIRSYGSSELRVGAQVIRNACIVAAHALVKEKPGRTPLRATLRHQVIKHYANQCSHTDAHGRRCPEKRWLDIHHVIPVAKGGLNLLSNLRLLCSRHHAALHRATAYSKGPE